VRRSGLVVLRVALLLAAAFFVDAILTPQPAPMQEIPPGEPGGFSPPRWVAAGSDGEQILLRWRSVPGALAYTLRRSRNPDGGYRVIHMGRDTTYADRDGLVPESLYCYLLSAIDPEFDESGQSREQCVEFGRGRDETGN
jgi:hypothetical protein